MFDCLNTILLAAKALSATEAVYLQLAEDYPHKAISWVKDYDWDWPHAVPLADIDFEHKSEWGAEEHKAKIEKFKEKITSGLMKPAILVKPKGSKLYVIVDGHHRGIANHQLNRPMLAWTVSVDSDKGPWDIMHDQQVRGTKVKASRSNVDMVVLAARVNSTRNLDIVLNRLRGY